ncbi:MAG: NYN domain-containing protein, partial [Bacillota bacterium]|nr:NYN domain-containing protein [Bacillota bacterium]
GIDYKKMKERLRAEFGFTRIDGWYFDSITNTPSPYKEKFYNWLKTAEPNGPGIKVNLYGLKKKTYVCKNCNKKFFAWVQKGVDVGIATTALRFFDRYDAIVLSAGDGDFKDFIRFIVEDKDKNLYIASFSDSISPDIQQYCLKLYALEEHYADICDTRDTESSEALDETLNEIETTE